MPTIRPVDKAYDCSLTSFLLKSCSPATDLNIVSWESFNIHCAVETPKISVNNTPPQEWNPRTSPSSLVSVKLSLIILHKFSDYSSDWNINNTLIDNLPYFSANRPEHVWMTVFPCLITADNSSVSRFRILSQVQDSKIKWTKKNTLKA